LTRQLKEFLGMTEVIRGSTHSSVLGAVDIPGTDRQLIFLALQFSGMCISNISSRTWRWAAVPARFRFSLKLYSLPALLVAGLGFCLHIVTQTMACLLPWSSGSCTLFQQDMNVTQRMRTIAQSEQLVSDTGQDIPCNICVGASHFGNGLVSSTSSAWLLGTVSRSLSIAYFLMRLMPPQCV